MVKILAISLLPENSNYIDVDTSFQITLTVLNLLKDQNLDCAIKIVTKDEVDVFTAAAMLSTQKNSGIGIYSIAFQIPNFLLNADLYRVDLVIGQDQRHVVFKEQSLIFFEILNTNTGRGSNMNRAPGIVRPKINNKVTFKEITNEVPSK